MLTGTLNKSATDKECCETIRAQTMIERLEQQKSNLISHLNEIEQAIKALKRNPELEQLVTQVRRVL